MSAPLQDHLKLLADRAQTIQALLTVIGILEPAQQGECLTTAAAMTVDLGHDLSAAFGDHFYCPDGLPAAPRIVTGAPA